MNVWEFLLPNYILLVGKVRDSELCHFFAPYQANCRFKCFASQLYRNGTIFTQVLMCLHITLMLSFSGQDILFASKCVYLYLCTIILYICIHVCSIRIGYECLLSTIIGVFSFQSILLSLPGTLRYLPLYIDFPWFSTEKYVFKVDP